MFINKRVVFIVLLNILSAAHVWALGEPADEVVDIIESKQPAPVKSDPAEKAARIAAARRAAALKKAEEKAVAEKKEKERLNQPTPANTEKAASIPTPPPEKTVDQKPLPASPQTVPSVMTAEVPPKTSWWSAFTGMLGLTDSNPGITVQAVSSEMASPASDYIIGPGDLIGISVWKDESLTRTVVVLPDGRITFPLLGELTASGKTVAQLKQELEKALSRYTADSYLTVEVKQSNSMVIYITGRVNAPGRQLLVANTNVLQALAMAGGPNSFAQRNKIRIFRQHESKTVMFSFNYDDVMEGRHLETNIDLKRGDVIIVP